MREKIFISGGFSTLPVDQTNLCSDVIEQTVMSLIDNGFRVSTGMGQGIGLMVLGAVTKKVIIDNAKILSEFRKETVDSGEYLHVGKFPFENPEEMKRLAPEIRKDLIGGSISSVFICGQSDRNEQGLALGMLEAYELAQRYNHIMLPIGSTGYMAEIIWDKVNQSDEDYTNLSVEEFEMLKTCTDATVISDLIVKAVKTRPMCKQD